MVSMMDSEPSRRQGLHLRVGLGDELDHEPRGERSEELRLVVQRLVARERQVMDQGQGHDDVGAAAIEDRGPLAVPPAGTGAGIEQVEHQGPEPRLAAPLASRYIRSMQAGS